MKFQQLPRPYRVSALHVVLRAVLGFVLGFVFGFVLAVVSETVLVLVVGIPFALNVMGVQLCRGLAVDNHEALLPLGATLSIRPIEASPAETISSLLHTACL